MAAKSVWGEDGACFGISGIPAFPPCLSLGIEGSTSVGFFTHGTMTGSFRFVSDTGQTANCTVVSWSLQPVG
jgi:hypothetical protein